MTEYRIFIDESGNHDLNSIDTNYPIFCLVGCIFEKEYYHKYVRSEFDNLKIRFWGSPEVIFHSREIRKREGCFSILNNEQLRNDFYNCLNEMIGKLQFSIIASVILKSALRSKYTFPSNPYHLSLEFIMERFCNFMNHEGHDCTGFMMAESRGDPEDKLLKTEYQRLHDNGNQYIKNMPNITGLWCEKKKKNIAGLQIADLIAYPTATRILRPSQDNKAFDVFKEKFLHGPKSKGASIFGYGIKVFPS